MSGAPAEYACREELAEPVIVDLRNIYDPVEMEREGFRYSGVGR